MESQFGSVQTQLEEIRDLLGRIHSQSLGADTGAINGGYGEYPLRLS